MDLPNIRTKLILTVIFYFGTEVASYKNIKSNLFILQMQIIMLRIACVVLLAASALGKSLSKLFVLYFSRIRLLATK